VRGLLATGVDKLVLPLMGGHRLERLDRLVSTLEPLTAQYA
jgi:hypothetical protein